MYVWCVFVYDVCIYVCVWCMYDESVCVCVCFMCVWYMFVYDVDRYVYCVWGMHVEVKGQFCGVSSVFRLSEDPTGPPQVIGRGEGSTFTLCVSSRTLFLTS